MIKNNSVNYDTLYLIFVFSIGSTLFTAIRFPNLSIGLGEILILIIGVYIILKMNKEINNNLFFNNLLLKYWIFSFILLFIGFLVFYYLGYQFQIKAIIHDLLAYIFIFFLLIVLHLFQLKINNHEKTFEIFIYVFLFFYVILFIVFISFEDIISKYITPEYPFMVRYAGLSLNANQLSMFFTVLPFIFLKKLLNKNIKETEKYFFLILLSILIGYLTKSDALKMSIIIGFIIFVYLKFNTNLIRLSIYLIILLFIISCFLYFDTVIYIIDPETTNSGGRFLLIKNAFYDLSNIIYFGFGPGPHSFIESAFNGNYWEVHNTFIDWFTQTGILGLLLYFYIIYKIIKGLYIKKEFILLSAFSSLLIFSTFHFTFRQPIFWFFMFFFYIMSQGEKKCVE